MKLNEQQRFVVENRTDHLLLLAGAGSGKTAALALRIAEILREGTAKPEELLCLTFTNRACKEMSERITQTIGADAQKVVIRTVHSFCVWLLRHCPTRLQDVGVDFSVCDEADTLQAIRGVVQETIGREPDERSASILQQFISMAKECQLAHGISDPVMAVSRLFLEEREKIERICIDSNRSPDQKFFAFLSRYGASVLRMYNLRLQESGLLDFDDLLLRADAALSDPVLSNFWGNRFRFVHVDEVQDVSLAEYRLICRLCKQAKVLFCGDFNQTIYQWRGSQPKELIEQFTCDFSARIVQFTINYRSSGQLYALAQNYLHNAFGYGQSSRLDPFSKDCTDIHFSVFESPKEESAWIIAQIKALGITDYSRVAVLTRSNYSCTALRKRFTEQTRSDASPIEFMLADEFRLLRRAEIKDLTACIAYALNPADGESLRRILARLVQGIGTKTLDAVALGYKQGLGVALTDFFDPYARANEGDYFERLLSALDAGQITVFDVESTGTDIQTDEIIQIAAIRLGVDGQVQAKFEKFLRPMQPVGDSEQVHGFSDTFLQEHGEDPVICLMEFLDFVGDTVIVGHNVGFDLAITTQNLKHHQIDRAFSPYWYDTLDLSRRFLKKLPNHKLNTVSTALQTAHAPSHNAMDDILATAEVLTKLTDQFVRPQTEERRAFYQKLLPRFAAAHAQLAPFPEKLSLGPTGFVAWIEQIFSLRGHNHVASVELDESLALFGQFMQMFLDPQKSPEAQCRELLELSALSASELSQLTGRSNRVAVITVHQAKGCEYDYVFLPNLQENVFPACQSLKEDRLEEEKRLFYVSITRARCGLFLSYSKKRDTGGRMKESRFLPLLRPANTNL